MDSKIAPKAEQDYPWYARAIFKRQRKKYGHALEPAKLWARSPRLLLGVSMLYGALDRKSSPLSPEIRALITVRVSQINHCSFCVDINSALVLERGSSRDKLNDLKSFRESTRFSEAEKAALEYAEALTYTEGQVDDGLWSRLQSYYADDVLVELTGLIAFQNLSSKFNAGLNVQPQGFCSLE